VLSALIKGSNPHSGDDGRDALGPVEAVPADDTNAVAVAPDDEAIAVVLDLVRPLRPGWHAVGASGKARHDEAGRKRARQGSTAPVAARAPRPTR